MILTRQQLADAIHFWGEKAGPGDRITLPKEAGKLVDVLATMDFAKESSVELGDNSERAELARVALEALAARRQTDGRPTP